MLVKEFPEVIVLSGNGNLFWSAAINLGIRHALTNGAEFILTLNNDTVASENFLAQMLFWSNQTPDSLLGALDVDTRTQKPYYGGELINWKWRKSQFLFHTLREENHRGLHEVFLYTGPRLLIPKNVFYS